jgi:hypothetical protein
MTARRPSIETINEKRLQLLSAAAAVDAKVFVLVIKSDRMAGSVSDANGQISHQKIQCVRGAAAVARYVDFHLLPISATVGLACQPDEGTPAHIFQLWLYP